MATYGTFVDGVTLTASEANSIGVWNDSATPVIRQPSSILIQTGTTSYMNYVLINKLVYVQSRIVLNGAGTANTVVLVDMPITAAAGSAHVIGEGRFNDSGTDQYLVRVVQYSTTRFAFLTTEATSTTMYVGLTGGPGPALATNDSITFRAVYEAA